MEGLVAGDRGLGGPYTPTRSVWEKVGVRDKADRSELGGFG